MKLHAVGGSREGIIMPVTEYLERNAREYPDEVALVELNPDKSIIEEMYLPNRMKLLGFSDAAIRKIENFMFSKNGKGEDIESGAIVNVIIEEFYDNETPVLERYYKLLMILDDDFLCAEDIAGIEEKVLALLRQDGKLSANQLSMSIITNAYR